jgi:peptidoglycan hydrolase-like protein with peptidoglycan-binding domain
LKARGLYAGIIDGYVTNATMAAIRRFQQSRRLSETGAMDIGTLSVLGGSCIGP